MPVPLPHWLDPCVLVVPIVHSRPISSTCSAKFPLKVDLIDSTAIGAELAISIANFSEASINSSFETSLSASPILKASSPPTLLAVNNISIAFC